MRIHGSRSGVPRPCARRQVYTRHAAPIDEAWEAFVDEAEDDSGEVAPWRRPSERRRHGLPKLKKKMEMSGDGSRS